jgi:hypothetical protein
LAKWKGKSEVLGGPQQVRELDKSKEKKKKKQKKIVLF